MPPFFKREVARRKPWRRDSKGAHEGRRLWRKQAVVSPVGTELRRAQCAKQAVVSPMRAKETAQPVAAIAVDEPSEAGSISSELCERREATMLN